MRKWFAAITGIGLAVVVALSYTGRLEIPWREWRETLMKPFENGSEPKPKLPAQDATVQAVDQESNLTYVDRIKKGDYYHERGLLTYAVNEYVMAAQLQPQQTEPYLKLMQTQFELADYEKAQLQAETLLKLNPDMREVQLFMGRIQLKKGELAEAEKTLTQLRAHWPEEGQVDYALALTKIVLGKNDEAKPLLESARKKTTDPVPLKAIETMLAAYEEFDFAQGGEPLYLQELQARALNQTGEYELALTHLKNILRQRSDLRDAWIMLGFSYLNLEKYYFALTSFEKAYDLDAEWPATQYFLSLTHEQLGELDKAIIYMNYAVSNGFEPEIVAQRKLADLYLAAKNYSEAVKTYEQVLVLNGQDVSAFVRPVWIYLDYLKQPENAVKLAEKAFQAFPNDPMALNLMGWSQTGVKQYADAEKNLKKALELNPKLAAAYLNLGNLYEVQSKKELAVQAFQSAYTLDSQGSIGRLAAERYNALMTNGN